MSLRSLPSHFTLLRAAGIFLALPEEDTADALFSLTPEESARRRLRNAQAAYDAAIARLGSATEEEKPDAFAALAEAKARLHEAGRALGEARRVPPA